MNKFESPEISVVMFTADTVITTSSNEGYESNKNNGSWLNFTTYNMTDGSGDGMPL